MGAETFDKYDIVQDKVEGELFLILGTCYFRDSNEYAVDCSAILLSECGKIAQASCSAENRKNYRLYSKGCASNVYEAIDKLRDLYTERNTQKYGTEYEEYLDRMAKEYEAEQAYAMSYMN